MMMSVSMAICCVTARPGATQVDTVISFLAFPMVSSQAFRAFVCEDIGDHSYLKVDYSIECTSVAYSPIQLCATLAVLLYSVGIPLGYAMLLHKVRHAALNNEATHLSEALGFLHRPYKPQFYW